MINTITEIIGSTYWLKGVAAGGAVSEKSRVKMDYKDKLSHVAQLQQIKALKELKAEKEYTEEEVYVKADFIINEKGERSVVLVTNNMGYREINLDGGMQQKMINPLKVKKAYFEK